MRYFLFLLILGSLGCSKESGTSTTTSTSYRWVARTIYLAYPDSSDSSRNNYFQKESIKDAVKEITKNSMYGENYFAFEETDEANLTPIAQQTSAELKNFILIWPDSVYNVYVSSTFGSVVPDTNAVTVINSANKKYFYMIFKASCFQTSASCNYISNVGLKALIARQLGFLNGLSSADCSIYPGDVMCTTPSDTQWSTQNSFKFYNALNNMLETILNTPGFY